MLSDLHPEHKRRKPKGVFMLFLWCSEAAEARVVQLN